MRAEHGPSWRTWLLLVPLLAWMLAFVVAPAAILVVYSFAERDELGRVILGFSLENFDPLGRWRTSDGMFPIDPAGSLASLGQPPEGSSASLSLEHRRAYPRFRPAHGKTLRTASRRRPSRPATGADS